MDTRRWDDSQPWKSIKEFWPLFLAVFTAISFFVSLETRVSAVEVALRTKSASFDNYESRITRLETSVVNMQQDLKDIKTDVRYLVSRQSK